MNPIRITLLSAVLAIGGLFPTLGRDHDPVVAPPPYKVEARYPLKSRIHGQSGSLVLLADKRMTALRRGSMEEYYWFGATADREVAEILDAESLAEAQIVLVDDGEKMGEPIPVGTPFARLRSTPNEFVLEVSQGGFGQFTGTFGRVFTIEQGSVRYLGAALDDAAGTVEDIVLQRSPGSDWRIIPASHGSDIYQVVCQPGEADENGFGEVYVTYRQDKSGWHKRQRASHGYCTWPDGFPPLRAFP